MPFRGRFGQTAAIDTAAPRTVESRAMKISIAGTDVTDSLGRLLADRAAALRSAHDPGTLHPDHSALSLKDSRDAQDYLARFVRLVRMRRGSDLSRFRFPPRPGFKGRAAGLVRSFLWRLLRCQHERTAQSQNVINDLLVNAIEFQQEEIRELRRRLDGPAGPPPETNP